jgi:FAD/FMN-containing dehydrogenase
MLKDAIAKIIRGEVSDSQEELKKFSEDASIFRIKPQLVVKPQDAEDVKKLVKFAAEKKKSYPGLSLTARAAGTDMSGGPLNESLILDFTAHFNRILEVGENYAITEPGVYYRDFEKETLKKNLLLPSYPASREICTVGGMVANNSGGEKSLAYGKTEDYVEELEVVLADGSGSVLRALNPKELAAKKKLKNLEGKIYREMHVLLTKNYDLLQKAKPNVHKNSAGYFLWNVWDKKTFNLAKLLTGSQGTLALITKIKFRLVKVKPYSELLVMFLKSTDILGKVVAETLKFRPESFESYDDNTFKLAVKFLPELLTRMGGNLFKLGLQFLPELWLTLTGGVPKLVLIAEFTGETEAEVQTKVRLAENAIRNRFNIKTHRTRDPKEAQKYWVMRRESFNLLRRHIRGKHTAPFIDDFVVRPEFLPEFLPRLDKILAPYKDQMIYTIAGHSGEGNFHIIPLMNLELESQRRLIPELSEKVYNLVAEYKGSTTGEHNDGIIRTPYLNKIYPPAVLKLFVQTKQIFDPQNIFNPGKKVGGTIADILKHMKRF